MSERDRITTLELLAAEHEKTIEELSDQIARQWTQIEALQKRLDVLLNRISAVEDRAAPDIPVTRPPHW